jgi:hypothetical protein
MCSTLGLLPGRSDWGIGLLHPRTEDVLGYCEAQPNTTDILREVRVSVAIDCEGIEDPMHPQEDPAAPVLYDSDTDPPALGCTFSHSDGSLLQTVHMRIMLCESCPLKPAVCVRRERLFTHRRSAPAVRFAGWRSAARISRCRSADARSSLTCPSELFSTHLCEDQAFRARCLSSLSLEARERTRSHSRAPSPPRRTSRNGTH